MVTVKGILTQVTEIGPYSLASPSSVQYFSHFACSEKLQSKMSHNYFILTFPISTSLHAMITICRIKVGGADRKQHQQWVSRAHLNVVIPQHPPKVTNGVREWSLSCNVLYLFHGTLCIMTRPTLYTVHQTTRNTYIYIVSIDVVRMFNAFNHVQLNSGVFNYKDNNKKINTQVSNCYSVYKTFIVLECLYIYVLVNKPLMVITVGPRYSHFLAFSKHLFRL